MILIYLNMANFLMVAFAQFFIMYLHEYIQVRSMLRETYHKRMFVYFCSWFSIEESS